MAVPVPLHCSKNLNYLYDKKVFSDQKSDFKKICPNPNSDISWITFPLYS